MQTTGLDEGSGKITSEEGVVVEEGDSGGITNITNDLIWSSTQFWDISTVISAYAWSLLKDEEIGNLRGAVR